MEPPEERDDDQRREIVEKKVDEMSHLKTGESVDLFLKALETMPLTELQKLRDDEQYRNDNMFTMPAIMKMQKKQDAIEDDAAKKAK